MNDEITIAVLREIRDEIRGTREEIRSTRTELGARIDATNERLGAVEGAVLELAEQQRFVVRWLKADHARGGRVEADVEDLKGRVDRIEARLGPEAT
ncbi:MAG: hypothetical protein AAGE52_09825 [Myxococcota bacterium]